MNNILLLNSIQNQNEMYIYWISIPIFIISINMAYKSFKGNNIKNSLFVTILCTISLAGILYLVGMLKDEYLLNSNIIMNLVIFFVSVLLTILQLVLFVKSKRNNVNNTKNK